MAGHRVAAPAAVEVSIVVPTRNEAANVAALYTALDQALQAAGRQSYELLFVDGQSTDVTADNVRKLAAYNTGRVRLMVRESRHSLSAAVIDGFANTRADVIVVMDADLQHPPEVVPRLLAALADGADIAVASRYTAGGDSELGWFRNLFSRACTRLVRTALGSGFDISDPLSGFFALRRRVIAGRTLSGAGFKILMEVLACGDYREVREVPFRFVQRQHGKSKLGPGTALRDVRGLLRAAREFRRRKSTVPGAGFRVPS
jgi:dolichol-phosphate mannosyltransferase